MSWIDRIQNGITITCGDGKSYSPEWLNAVKQIEWNVSEFIFPGLDGSLVKKKKKLGTRYSLEFYFQGAFHLDQSAEFETSANDSRPWVIAHPFYGSIIVQAPSFTVDNSGLNVSKWTGTVIETILESGIKTTADPVEAIALQKNLLDESFAQSLLAKPSVPDVAKLKAKNKSTFNLTVPIIKIPEEAATYFNLFNTANAAVSTAIASPLLAMRTTIAMLTEPAKFSLSVSQRIETLKKSFADLSIGVAGLLSPASKQIYQATAGSLLSAMCLTSSLPQPTDFGNSKRVLVIVDTITEIYDEYLANLDLLQTLTGGAPDSFIPDAESLISLSELINLAVSNLFNIALTARNERFVILEKDTNIILLTHRFYGLDLSDNNINEMFENNGFGLNHLLQIKKNTKVVYYI